ncbi:MAG: serine/threonine protein phosphatase [Deltaproteobacteria bacterium]|nr:serine/threonine protein phosphatase [Deltaproteobacteria bacterium]
MSRRFAIGDIHGCLKTFRALVENEIQLKKGDELFLIGDFIDRGPDSKGVLDYIVSLTGKGYNLRAVRGNHEEMLLESLNDERFLAGWLDNGAESTLNSFGIDTGLFITMDSVTQINQKYIDLLSNLPYYFELQDYLIVHAGFNFYMQNSFNDNNAMVWSRDNQFDAEKSAGRSVIHGHTPVSLDIIKQQVLNPDPGLINIDGGCVYTNYPDLGNLVALNLDSREIICQRNIEE